MGAQDRTEKVLRDIHVLFSKAEPYNGSKRRVVVDKNEMMDLLKELNGCMYDMLEEHELTVQSRDKASRQIQKANDDMIFEARKNAQDVYAASIMYSDHALAEIQNIMDDAYKKIEETEKEMLERISEERHKVKDNQYELKSQLQGLVDTEKYLRLIEEENKRVAQLKESGKLSAAPKEPSYKDVKPEIRINEDYFRAAGIPFDDEDGAEAQEEPADSGTREEAEKNEAEKLSDERIAKMQAELDAEYFEWKEEPKGTKDPNETERRTFPLFGKKE